MPSPLPLHSTEIGLVVFVALDGTLLDTDRAAADALTSFVLAEPAWRHVMVAPAVAAWRQASRSLPVEAERPPGRRQARLVATLAEELGVRCTGASAAAWADTITQKTIARCQAHPDAVQFLDEIGPLGAITDDDRLTALAKLHAARLDPYRFDPLVVARDVGAIKHSATLFERAADAAEVSPAACALISDDPGEADAARAAGFAHALVVDRTPSCPFHVSPILTEALARLAAQSLNRPTTRPVLACRRCGARSLELRQ